MQYRKLQEEQLLYRMSKEFLTERLGIEASPGNIERFVKHIKQFEREASTGISNKSVLTLISS